MPGTPCNDGNGHSGIVLAVLLAGMLFFQFGRGSWLNYGVDFLGGTLVQVQVERETDVNELRAAGVLKTIVERARLGGVTLAP